jgi:hypothetical protein
MNKRVVADTDFEKWKFVTDETFTRIYSISIDDAGLDDEYLRSHFELPQSPLDFVMWFGNKYDLTE